MCGILGTPPQLTLTYWLFITWSHDVILLILCLVVYVFVAFMDWTLYWWAEGPFVKFAHRCSFAFPCCASSLFFHARFFMQLLFASHIPLVRGSSSNSAPKWVNCTPVALLVLQMNGHRVCLSPFWPDPYSILLLRFTYLQFTPCIFSRASLILLSIVSNYSEWSGELNTPKVQLPPSPRVSNFIGNTFSVLCPVCPEIMGNDR